MAAISRNPAGSAGNLSAHLEKEAPAKIIFVESDHDADDGSTSGFISACSQEDLPRSSSGPQARFHANPVSDVRTFRPATDDGVDKSDLYYDPQDIQGFRAEYRALLRAHRARLATERKRRADAAAADTASLSSTSAELPPPLVPDSVLRLAGPLASLYGYMKAASAEAGGLGDMPRNQDAASFVDMLYLF